MCPTLREKEKEDFNEETLWAAATVLEGDTSNFQVNGKGEASPVRDVQENLTL